MHSRLVPVRRARRLFVSKALTVLISGLGVAACGGGGTDTPSPSPAPLPVVPTPPPPPPPPNAAAVSPINTADKAEVIARFRDTYSDSTPWSWVGGSVADCRPGALATAYRSALVKRINYFRAMAGLPGDLVENEGASVEAQAAALLMEANFQLNHNPPSTWKCYSALGASGASKSNLCLGCASNPPLWMVNGFMIDPGDNNKAVGHRRWLLYSRLAQVGVGETAEAGAIHVSAGFTSTIPPSALNGIAWPNRGYVPRQLFNPSDRWSYSCTNGNFGGAVVDMRDSLGRPIAVFIESRTGGSGDSAIVWSVDLAASPQNLWDPGSASTAAETKVTVTINGVLGCGTSTSHTYSTTIFRVTE